MQPLLPTGGLGKKAEAEEQGSLTLSESGGRKKQNEETTTEETLHHLAKIDNTGKGGCNAL